MNVNKFPVLFTEQQIVNRCKDGAAWFDNKFRGLDERPVLLGVMNGCIPFFYEIAKRLQVECEWEFLRIKSYVGTTKNDAMSLHYSFPEERLQERHVIVLDDIVDSGQTMLYVHSFLQDACKVQSITTMSLLDKPSCREVELTPDWSAFHVDDFFVVGFGLDHDGAWRGLRDIREWKP